MAYYNFLLSGPIAQAERRRQELTERMANDLLKAPETLVDDWDAVQFLRSKGYGPVDVAVVAGAARYLACQELIAREMSSDTPSLGYWKSSGAFAGLRIIKGSKP